MNKSDSITKLAEALAKAQSEMKNPAFDAKNPHFNNRFASLPAVREATVPVLNKHGICVMQLLGGDDTGLTCETTLLHSSGEWVSGSFYMPVAKRDPQGYGSAATYARRYALQAICGVVGDEDDDGNEASKAEKKDMGIRPSAGALEKLSTDMQTYVTDSAAEVMALFSRGDVRGAHDHYQDIKANLEPEHEQVAFWSLLNSKCRSAIMKHGATLKEKASAV